jgi:hypothetical protein
MAGAEPFALADAIPAWVALDAHHENKGLILGSRFLEYFSALFLN